MVHTFSIQPLSSILNMPKTEKELEVKQIFFDIKGGGRSKTENDKRKQLKANKKWKGGLQMMLRYYSHFPTKQI